MDQRRKLVLISDTSVVGGTEEEVKAQVPVPHWEVIPQLVWEKEI